MKKIKICGVSLCTLLAAGVANAAGYTCEELIEYTSCNAGYALVSGDCIRTCDAGYFLSGTDCKICPVGSYSLAGASECTTCPTTGMVDSTGKEVVATTASAGAGGISSCIIPTDVIFKDNYGYYHFKSNCAYSGLAPDINGGSGGDVVVVPTLEEACHAAGYESCDVDEGFWCDSAWMETVVYEPTTGKTACYENEHVYGVENGDPAEALAALKSGCAESGGTWDIDNITCDCPSGTSWMINGESGDVRYWTCF